MTNDFALVQYLGKAGSFDELASSTAWEQRNISIYGKVVPEPRLTAWYGDVGYRYSGIDWQPKPWTDLLSEIRDAVASQTGESFNSVLLNFYRDGRDSIGFHCDNEPELGDRPTIATLSFGTERTLKFKAQNNRVADISFSLGDRSLLIMRGNSQKNWKHGIAKVANAGPRISLTFRNTLDLRHD